LQGWELAKADTGKNYRGQADYLEVGTNGTFPPREPTWETFRLSSISTSGKFAG